ncbi:MAG: BamA/TamA family outer membrane protein [Cyclobacteriaceae bacterium]|nr:BamA/TamA family outer membrane protein [Cyclobacteriaceae bacterium]
MVFRTTLILKGMRFLLCARFALGVILSLVFCHVAAQNQGSNFFTKKDSAKASYKNKLLVFPIVASSPETSWVFGIANAFIFKTAKSDSVLRVSTIPSGILYTLNNQILIALGANIFLPKERYIIRFENSFSKFPDKFWGIGNNTGGREENPERYTFTQFYINPQLYRKVKGALFAGAGVDFQRVFDVEYEPNKYFVQDKVLGVYDRSSYSVFGLSLFINYDSRNHAYVPDRGSLFRVRFSSFDKNIGSDYNFRTLELDFRKFIRVTRKSVFAVQSFNTFNFGDVPFRNLAILGGNSIMRGYFSGRFRDNKFAGVQVEYRFPLIGRFGGVAFAGFGQVANGFGDFAFDKIKPSIGTGIRAAVLRKEKLNLRFDIATGAGGSLAYYVVLAESF